MSVRFHDFGSDPTPNKKFHSASELIAFLKLSTEPVAGELTHDNGFMLTMGLDGDLAFAQFSNAEGDPPCLVALPPTKIVETSHNFIVTNSATEVRGKYCLAHSVFFEVVSHFVETGEGSPSVTWKEI